MNDETSKVLAATESRVTRATHGRHCSCTACKQEDWTRIDAPCGVHGPGCPAVYDPRPVIHIVESTITERYYYDPAEIKLAFGDAWDAYTGSFEDFVVELFEEHDGSVFHGRFFQGDASPDVGVTLVRRYDDE